MSIHSLTMAELVEKLTVENTELRRQLTLKEKLLIEIGKQLQEAQRLQVEYDWHRNLRSVSFKRCSTPEKHILEELREIHQGNSSSEFEIQMKPLAAKLGMGENSLRTHLTVMEGKGLISRRYAGSENQKSLIVGIDDRVLANPFAIHKIVPVERQENRGGKRAPKPDDLICPNCGSHRATGHRHVDAKCDDCQRFFVVWEEFERGEKVHRSEEIDDTGQAPAPPLAPIISPVQSHFTITEALPPLPDTPCRSCKRPRRVCWKSSPEAPGIWMRSCP